MNKIKSVAKSIGYSWNLILQSSRYMIFLYFVLMMITTSFPLLSAFLLKYILDVLTSNAQETGKLWMIIIIYGMSLVVNQGMASAKGVVRSCINQKAEHLYEYRLAEKLAALPMEILDSSEGRDLIDEVRYTESAAVYMTFQVADVISQAYTFAVAFAILTVFSPGFSLMFLVFTISGMICNEYYIRKSDELRARMAPDVRKFCYYRWMLTDAWPAKDVRMYDLTDSIRKRYQEEKAGYLKAQRKLGKKALSGRLFIELFRRSGEIVFITYVVFSALDGRIGIGDVALYIGFANTIANSLLVTAGFVRISKLMKKLFDFLSIKTEQKQGNRKLDTFISLAFDNVYFKYPHTETYVLSGVSFTVNKGDKLSIVGINGSGKSTIIKLMLGLYQIESGQILINGYPMSDYDMRDVRKLFSALFQNFVQYPLTLRENIALSSLERIQSREAIKDVLIQSGIYEDIKPKLENGLDSFMTRQFDDKGLSTTVIPLVEIWLWKEVLNGIVNDKSGGRIVIVCLAVYLALQLAAYMLSQFDFYVNDRFSDELQFYIESVMMEKTSRMDLSFFDSAKMGDKVRHARSNFGIMSQMTWLVFDILSAFINVAATLVIVCTYKWWLGLVTLMLLIPFLIYNQKRTEHKLEMEKEQLRDNRKKDYYFEVFFDNNIQFEIKLNNIGAYFIEKYKEIWKKLYHINQSEEIGHNMINTLIMIVNVSSEFLVLTLSVFDVVNQKIGIGDLQYNLSMVSRLRGQAQGLMDNVNRFLNNNARLIELQEFMDIRPEVEKSGTLKPSSNPKIEFCNVSFRYPNAEQYVLKDCSFTIEPHEKIGLIGLNGAGKSTIIKLMFRFYDPEEGCIRLDGVDLKEYDIYAVRKVFGVLFQDYVTYCLPLREIIALSDFDERFNDEKLKTVCDISGASEIIKDWENGFDSVLGRYYADNGKDLSGGQWQLVGLARAYFKDSEYLILDEPSAALDPISEDRIFEQLYHLSEGKSSVTISHRLSNTTLADKILVIGDGHIIEQGSHDALLKQNGKYAQLFRLQASKYI